MAAALALVRRLGPAVRIALALVLTGAELGVGASVRSALVMAQDPPPPRARINLDDPIRKEIAMRIVSTNENSSLDWRAQYAYLEDINDHRGYTGGIIGFTSGTGDMLELIHHYTRLAPDNLLARYLPALAQVRGTSSHRGLGSEFVRDWRTAALDPLFQRAQDEERDRVYFHPAVSQGQRDGLGALGQFIYFDAIIMHGPENDRRAFGGIRAEALRRARTPAEGGAETTYLHAFLSARAVVMEQEPAHHDTTRIDTEQRWFVDAANLDLNLPLYWRVYGESYAIEAVN